MKEVKIMDATYPAHTTRLPSFPTAADADRDRNLTPELFAARWNQNRKVWASDFKQNLRASSREHALGLRFIQTNAKSSLNLITVDLDLPDAWEVMNDHCFAGRLPTYAYLVVNQESGHLHAGWFIEGEARTKKQQQLFAVIRDAFQEIAGGDAGYTGYATRNPLSRFDQWTDWGTDHEYSFRELLAFIPEEVKAGVEISRQEATHRLSDGDLSLNPDSTTRNRDLFQVVRKYLYGKQHRADFLSFALSYALTRNEEFTSPLLEGEVRGIVNSITRFCLTRMDAPRQGGEGFCEAQRRRSQLAPQVKGKEARYARVLGILEGGGDTHDVGLALNIKPGAARMLILRVRVWAKEQEEATTQQGDVATRVSDPQSHTQPTTSPVTVEGIAVDAITGELLDATEEVTEEPALEKDILPTGVDTPVAAAGTVAEEEEEQDYQLGRVTVIDTTPEDWDPEVHRPIQHEPTPIDVTYPDWFLRGEKQPPKAPQNQQEEPVRMAPRGEIRSILHRLGAA